jgi:alkyl sulfatase BDS1-like metallo-beta-lactamase superfamily hydrolase
VSIAPDFVASLQDGQLFDAIAIQVDGQRAGARTMSIAWHFTDTARDYTLMLANGVLRHRAGAPAAGADTTIRVRRAAFNRLIAGVAQPLDLVTDGDLVIEGDAALFGELLGLLDPPDPNFAIVTP